MRLASSRSTILITIVSVAGAASAQTSGGSTGGGGFTGAGGSAGPSSGRGPSGATNRAGPVNTTTAPNRAVAPKAVPSPGNSPLPSQSSGTAPGATPGTLRSGQDVTPGSPSSGAAGDPTRVEPNFERGQTPAAAADGTVSPRQPSTGGIQDAGRRSSTTDTGAYGKTVDECMSAWDASMHMSKDDWRKTCERTTTR